MTPPQTRKRKSEEMEGERAEAAATTPTGTPARKKMRITQSQKQALIDNLQLESAYQLYRWAASMLTLYP
jgi:hypothetical protein